MRQLPEYTGWLEGLITDNGYKEYRYLLEKLNQIEAYFILDKDINRQTNALELRNDYIRATGDYDILSVLPGSCTVLELLISMAFEADDVMFDNDIGSRPNQWFWLFIQNLGLDICTDDRFFSMESQITNIITRWLDRRFSRNGDGSPWPRPRTQSDLRDIEMWYHMNWYLADNFDNM